MSKMHFKIIIESKKYVFHVFSKQHISYDKKDEHDSVLVIVFTNEKRKHKNVKSYVFFDCLTKKKKKKKSYQKFF